MLREDIELVKGRNYTIVLEEDGVYGYFKLPRTTVFAVLGVRQGKVKLAFYAEGLGDVVKKLGDPSLVPTHFCVEDKTFTLTSSTPELWVLENDLDEFLAAFEGKEKVRLSFFAGDEPRGAVTLPAKQFLKFADEYKAIVGACLAIAEKFYGAKGGDAMKVIERDFLEVLKEELPSFPPELREEVEKILSQNPDNPLAVYEAFKDDPRYEKLMWKVYSKAFSRFYENRCLI